MRRLLVVLALLGSVSACADDRPPETAAAARLEARLYAPCCWTQTLDVHASPLADELRAEITTRLRAGEAEQAIERDLVTRYGERVRASPEGFVSDRLVWPLVLVALASLGLVAWWSLRRVRAAGAPALAAAGAGAPTLAALELEDRLDDELRELD